MKRSAGIFVSVVLAVLPLTARAATVSAGQDYTLPSQQAVDGNLYVAAGTVTVGGRVGGDVVGTGGTISLTGPVLGGLLLGGGDISVLAPVSGSVRVVGGTVTINDRIGGDLVVLGGTVHLLPGASVQGDVIAAAGRVILDVTQPRHQPTL